MIAARPRRDRVLAPPARRVFGSTVSAIIRERTMRCSARAFAGRSGVLETLTLIAAI
jgi:hypothetical protein